MRAGKIFVIPSPISENTQKNVITNEVKETIMTLNVFFVENLRTARRYISSLNLNIDISGLDFFVLDKNTDDQEITKYLEVVLSGTNVGVISEAGCPGIADPGSQLISKAHLHSIQVVPLTGPSSIFLALMSSGFNGQNFTFHGYLPIDRKGRQHKIMNMERDLNQKGYTQIFMETPYRNEKLFEDLLNTLNQNTLLCIACDISGESEFIKTSSIRNWRNSHPDLYKRPAIFLIGIT
jgi:16S rRNA (cytidine1402-2'-O)-methyltransferase